MGVEIILIAICIVVLLGIAIWYYGVIKKKTVDISPLSPNVLNLNPHLMNGHKFGFELNTTVGENGEHIVSVIPNDYLPDADGNTKDEIQPYTFVLGKSQRLSLGVGHLGAQKEGVIYLPSSFRRLDRKIAESEFGQFIVKGMERQEFENKVYYYLKKLERTTNRLLIAYPDKAVALANAEIKDTIQDALSSLSLKKDDEKKSSFGDRLKSFSGGM